MVIVLKRNNNFPTKKSEMWPGLFTNVYLFFFSEHELATAVGDDVFFFHDCLFERGLN